MMKFSQNSAKLNLFYRGKHVGECNIFFWEVAGIDIKEIVEIVKGNTLNICTHAR